MKNYLLLCLGLLCLSFTGCASYWNGVDAKGGMFGSYAGDYIVISQTGGVIADVWVLEHVFVESIENSDGWRFKDNDGNVVYVGGDAKVLRVDSKSTLRQYREYHMEFETQTYQEKYGTPKGHVRYHLRGRTSRFFERSKATEVAARYHLRGRSGRFFDRVRGSRTRSRGVC